MSWKLTNGDCDFITIHDECPDKIALLVMDVVSIYLTHFSDVYSDDSYCEVQNDL